MKKVVDCYFVFHDANVACKVDKAEKTIIKGLEGVAESNLISKPEISAEVSKAALIIAKTPAFSGPCWFIPTVRGPLTV
jgi:hypothetical protein